MFNRLKPTLQEYYTRLENHDWGYQVAVPKKEGADLPELVLYIAAKDEYYYLEYIARIYQGEYARLFKEYSNFIFGGGRLEKPPKPQE